MIELRWVQVPETTTQPPKLQWRMRSPGFVMGGRVYPGEWGEWQDVPTAIIPKDKTP